MIIKIKKLAITMCLLCAVSSMYAQAVLAPEVLQKVSQAVFEIVVLKPQTDSLTYEKPLPLDRLPFMERTDKYRSIGTAFLLKDGQFYTAAHVLNFTADSQSNDYFIRNAAGDVFPISTIYKFSIDRDFVVFTVEGFTFNAENGLEIAEKPAINSIVYTVGNAQGEGIVVRDGVFTSETFEVIDGKWKWLRFSAAASPGNSGGPLITAEGKVVGIVTMKNQNENLNYALPIEELQSIAENTGYVYSRVFYHLPNILSDKKFGEFELEVELPKPYPEVREEVKTAFHAFTKKIAKEFEDEFTFGSEKSITNIKLSEDLLFTSGSPEFPRLIINLEDKRWVMHYPGSNMKEIKLDQNGSVRYGSMIGYTFANIKKPDNVSLSQLINDPKTYMDYILTSATIARFVAGERITVTSFGEPVKTETHIDSFGRTWLASYWYLEFADYMAITYALPTPEGLFVLMHTANTDTVLNGINIDLAFMSDYVYTGYNGKVKDILEFLSLDPAVYPLYEPFSSMQLTTEEENTVLITPEWDINLPQDLMAIDEETRVSFSVGYTDKDGTLAQELRAFKFYYQPVTEDYRSFTFNKILNPPEGVSEDLTEIWQSIENKNFPFNADSVYNQGVTSYNEVLTDLSSEGESETEAVSALVLSLEIHGDSKDAEMTVFAEDAKKSITVK